MGIKRTIIQQRLRVRRKLRSYEKRFGNHPRLFITTIGISLFAIILTLVITLRDNTIRLNPREANIVILHVDDETRTIPTREATVKDMLKKSGITLHEGDVVEPSADTQIQEDDFRVNVYRAAPVTIVDGGKRITTLSAGQTPRAIAKQAGLNVYAEDNIEWKPSDDFINKGLGSTVSIDRATPTMLNLYGTPLALRTHARTVGDLLKEKDVQLANDDTVQPTTDTILTPQTQIFVTRFGTQVQSVEESIGFETQTVEDTSLSFGTQVTRQAGVNGKKSVTYQIETKNGVVISKTIIQQVVVQEPVPQIVARGQAVSIPADKEGIMRAAGISQSDFAYVNYIVSRESGWCPTKWQGQIGICPAYFMDIHPIDSGFGYGLGQATPAQKMAGFGEDWRTNPVTQLRWATTYAGRYGGWEGAYNQWINKHWW